MTVERKKIGLLINPIAGMGGRVGLKGTDGLAEEAVKRGAKPQALNRTAETLNSLKERDALFLTAGGDMGERAFEATELERTVVYRPDGKRTTSGDTKEAVKRMMEEGAGLIVFCGGDGTARDVFSITEDKVPVLGIPAGVKMHSSVFAVNPDAAAVIIDAFVRGEAELTEGEIMDIDEAEYRNGRLSARLFGIVRVPVVSGGIQGTKESYGSGAAQNEKEEIAQYLAEIMSEETETTFILGAGTTIAAVGKALGIEKTLLGVDIWRSGRILVKDAAERDILYNLTEKNRIVVTVIGHQGFVFGRGNQQISPEVIRRVGKENITIAATPTKLRATPLLRVDTGDPELDNELRGYVRVVTGYGRERMMKVE